MKLLFISLLIVWSSAVTAATKITSFVGDVKVLKTGSESWDKAAVSMALRNGDRIKTGYDSRAFIEADGNSIIVSPSSSLEITVDLIDDKPSRFLSMIYGRISLKMDRLKKNQGFGVKTPATVAAVRGTEFEVAAGLDGKSIIQVAEGSVSVSGIKSEVQVKANEQTSIMIGSDPEKITIIQRQDWEQWFKDSEKNARENALEILNGSLKRAETLDLEIKSMEEQRDKLYKEREEFRVLVEKSREEKNRNELQKYRRLQIDRNRRAYSLNAKIYYQASRIALVKVLADNIYAGADNKQKLNDVYKKIDKIYQVYYDKYIKKIEEERARRNK